MTRSLSKLFGLLLALISAPALSQMTPYPPPPKPVFIGPYIGGGTNIGSFHLVCNPPASSTTDGSYVGADGSVSAAGADVAGYYPHVG